ncbi:hypothetical protein WJ970_09640 [Achromobacter xylosoxidans]
MFPKIRSQHPTSQTEGRTELSKWLNLGAALAHSDIVERRPLKYKSWKPHQSHVGSSDPESMKPDYL